MTAGKAEGGSPVFGISEFSMLSGVMGEENKFWKNQGFSLAYCRGLC